MMNKLRIMKKLIYIFLILLGFTSCMKDDKVTLEPDATDKVDIIFGVTLPEPLTKSMADKPQVQNLRVAVFGGSGYLKEYVQAQPVELASENGDTHQYAYTVRLSLSDSHLKVHFIANGPQTLPFKYEDEVMAVQTTSGDQDAYWQRIELPNGITAKKDNNGEYIKTVSGEYVVSDDTKARFQSIPLIRNFAKIQVVSETDDFELWDYALAYKPTSGSIAVYNRESGSFIMNYKDLDFSQVKASYPGNMPATASINKTIPAPSEFSDAPVYMYERPIPTSDATFLLVHGKYKDGMDYYYRIELQNADGYYAIYRNFVYTIKIKGILRAGSANPEDAANSAGSGDVSTDQKAENLTDVSDGIARIFVEYTEKTLVGQGNVTLKFKFLPDASVDTPRNQDVTVTVAAPGLTGAVIDGDVTIGTDDDEQGWRTLSFNSTTPTDVTRSQSIRVTGNYGTDLSSKLFRVVTYKLMSIQNMQVVCDPHEIVEGKGKKVDVLIKIPKDLPRSIFPLQLQIESSKLSISPDNDNLPVNTGKSIIDGTSASYQFVKTLDYDVYLALQEASSDEWVTVPTHFKTTKELSGCDVYVANPYFHTAHDSFVTYSIKNFGALLFDNYSQSSANMPVEFTFSMDETDIPQKVTVKLTGLKPDPDAINYLTQIGTNTYEYTTTGSTGTIYLLTSTNDGYYRADISAPHYNDAYIDTEPVDYIAPKFVNNTEPVPFGIGQSVPFTFSFVAGAIEPVTFTLNNLVPDDERFQYVSDGVYTFTPNNSDETQLVYFKTTKFASDVTVTSMSGNHYNLAGPFSLSPAFTSVTVVAQGLNFTGTNAPTPGNNQTVEMTLYTSSGQVVGTCYVQRYGGQGNRSYRNNGTITINMSKFTTDEEVYFGYGNYYSTSSYTLTYLSGATTTNRRNIGGFQIGAPW